MRRPLSSRLIEELKLVRRELLDELHSLRDDQLPFAPSEGMKPYGVLIQEIATMQAETAIILCEGRVPEYGDLKVECRRNSIADYIELLESDLARIVANIESADEAVLSSPLPLEISWASYFGSEQIEPEELIRWIARHEYYHLAQIVTYRWIQGHNPYGERGWNS